MEVKKNKDNLPAALILCYFFLLEVSAVINDVGFLLDEGDSLIRQRISYATDELLFLQFFIELAFSYGFSAGFHYEHARTTLDRCGELVLIERHRSADDSRFVTCVTE